MNALMVNMTAIKMLNVKTREDRIHALAGQDSKETDVHVWVFNKVLAWSFPVITLYSIPSHIRIYKFYTPYHNGLSNSCIGSV